MISLISVTWIFSVFISTIKCETLQLDAYGDRILLAKILSCTANCLAIDLSTNLIDSFEKCQSNPEIQTRIIIEIPKSDNDSLRLICRDSDSLTIQVSAGPENGAAVRGTIYAIAFHEIDRNDSLNFMQISDAPFIQISNLTKNTEYNITASIFSNNNNYRRIDNHLNAKTLPMDNYTPRPIPEPIDIEYGFKNDSNLPFAMIRWQSDDMVCSYSFGIFILSTHKAGDPNNQFNRARLLTEPQTLGSYEISNLDFSGKYRLLIRGVNRKYHGIEGEPLEKEFRVPSCFRFHGIDYTKCIPMKPRNVTTSHESNGKEFHYNINVNWNQMDHFPDRYNVTLITKSNGTIRRTVSGTQNHVRFENVKIIDPTYDVILHAISEAGHSTAFAHNNILMSFRQKFWINSLIIAIFILALVTVLLLMVIFKNWQKKRRIDSMKFKDLAKQIQNDFYELNKSDMEMKAADIQITDEKLGEGHFGIVRKGIIKRTGQIVAVKMLKNIATIPRIEQTEIYQTFLVEIQLSKEVKHENILKTIGHCTTDFRHLMLVTEYCSEGNLLNHLRRNKRSGAESSPLDNVICNQFYGGDHFNSTAATINPLFVSNPSYGMLDADGHESPYAYNADVEEIRSLSYLDLLKIARQIASAMICLSRKKIIHRDLAARNILVCPNNIIKLTDFGLSRDIYNAADNIYKKLTAGHLPIKWMAFESIVSNVFTVQSDVWSYGVLLYEIMTLGSPPYADIPTDLLLDHLKSGRRLQKPDICSTEFYEMMLSCWHRDPNERPSFADLEQKIIEFEKRCEGYEAFTYEFGVPFFVV